MAISARRGTPGPSDLAASSLSKVPAPGQSTSETEIEWQFDAVDLRPVERWLAASPSPPGLHGAGGDGGFVIEALAPLQLVDAYVDTIDWRMSRSGFVLRIRRCEGGAEVTIKDGGERRDGLRKRLEVTEAL